MTERFPIHLLAETGQGAVVTKCGLTFRKDRTEGRVTAWESVVTCSHCLARTKHPSAQP